MDRRDELARIMSENSRPLVPIELWIFIVCAMLYWTLYWAASLTLRGPYVPANPLGLFTPLTAWIFVRSRARGAYWGTVAIASLAAAYPALSRGWMMLYGDQGSLFLSAVFVPPVILLGLMLSPRVRRYAKSRPAG